MMAHTWRILRAACRLYALAGAVFLAFFLVGQMPVGDIRLGFGEGEILAMALAWLAAVIVTALDLRGL
ncbi:hypothetical protein [Caulobacter segnis]|uniref:Uncharacterized protein n=1 Tax=Caulobacter segnis TaxID=88688 RepID=A0A2W5VB20_9CAUL|nr:hypothetical protein [Caulobacter segnis]PZR36462.1 MAG: hypothetical protein DI526_03220 [Caulobacter segnis]